MSSNCEYYLYQRYIKYGNSEYVPVFPAEYAISGDSNQPPVVKRCDSPNCGYCPPEYRWHALPIGEDYVCSGGNKYYKEVYQVSTDCGFNWENVVPESARTGNLYESGSSDCIEYRWVNMDISTDWVCDDCPEFKLKATYSDSTTYYVDCNSSTTLSSTEVSGHSTTKSLMTTAEIGDCATIIGSYAFYNCKSLTNIVIPDNVTSIWAFAFCKCTGLTGCDIGSGVTAIGDYAFRECYSLTSIDIPSGVTAIGDYAFRECYSLTSITISSGVTSIDYGAFYNCTGLTGVTVNAITPPSLGSSVFTNTNNCPIYVPAASVSAYQSASGWSTYASRIQAIP